MKCWKVSGVTEQNIKYNNYVSAKNEENAVANLEVKVQEKFTKSKVSLCADVGMYKILGTDGYDGEKLALINSRAQIVLKTVEEVTALVNQDKVVNTDYLTNYLADRDSTQYLVNS